ncbi:MAG: DUF6477 family protein [Thermohalobaculum sp.]|nr:DUF6477 family protein [Thermohalobaculum sp.]
MGLMESDLSATGEAGLMLRPRLLVEAARISARLRLDHGARPLTRQSHAKAVEDERGFEALRRAHSPLYRPSRHVEALAILFAERGLAAAPGQTKASGSAAFLRVI